VAAAALADAGDERGLVIADGARSVSPVMSPWQLVDEVNGTRFNGRSAPLSPSRSALTPVSCAVRRPTAESPLPQGTVAAAD
jgi:hypothetical protein